MSGTGLSQGSISSFGSIFVNGVEWDLSGATITLDGVAASEADLRVGMVVRVEGEFAAGGLTGSASSVRFDDAIEGPIENTPVETIAGLEKTFTVLGRSIVVRSDTTVFADGATFAGLAVDDVLEISGFVGSGGVIQATRLAFEGVFPARDEVELRGAAANVVANPDDTGMFDLGTIVVRYTATTTFSDVTRAALMSGDLVEVEGTLRPSGIEIDADRVELEEVGLGAGDADRVELEGIVASCAASPDFCIGSVPVDATNATFEPVGYMPMPGDFVEVEGALVSGTLIADRIEDEGEEDLEKDVKIDAAVMSVDAVSKTLVILGVTVSADSETRIEDKSSIDDESFMFSEIQPGDYVEIDGIATGTASVRALKIRREDATPGGDDVRLEGPVSAVDEVTPTLSILGQSIPLDGGTLYFDAMGNSLTEGQFFRDPPGVMVDDIVAAEDDLAADLTTLGEADEVEKE